MNVEITKSLINKDYARALQLSQVHIYKQVLVDTNGNVSKAAKLLGISRSHMYKQMRALS